MSKSKAVKVDHISDLFLDRPDTFLRLERRHWADGTSCLHIAKWSRQPNTGRQAPWMPQQYIQLPWEYAEALGLTILDGVARCEKEAAAG